MDQLTEDELNIDELIPLGGENQPHWGDRTAQREELSCLTQFLKQMDCCWGEIGNEPAHLKELFFPFEESQFYKIRKTGWLTEVPWKDKIWSGGVLLVIPDPRGNLMEQAKSQFEKFKLLHQRPLFKRVVDILYEEVKKDPGPHWLEEVNYLEFVWKVPKLILNQKIDDFEKRFPFNPSLGWTKQLMRQYYLQKRIKDASECLFYVTGAPTIPRGLTRAPFVRNGEMGTFFKIVKKA